MSVWRRILRYLILWAALFVILCIISVIRYWDELAIIVSGTFKGYFERIITAAVVGGLIIWGLRTLFRSFR